jgi:dethiobiotin synthetase
VSFFLTGTDTGVGKTFCAIHLLRLGREAGLRCAGMKPICCGDRDDAERLLAASSEGVTIDELNPVWLKTPAAPFAAALIESTSVDVNAILDGFADLTRRFDCVVVEGVGGWLVPIRADYLVSDLACALNLPVVVVAANRLGVLNHTALTVRSIESHGARCAGIVLNDLGVAADIATTTNGDILRRTVEVPILTQVGEKSAEIPADWRPLYAREPNRTVSVPRTQVY